MFHVEHSGVNGYGLRCSTWNNCDVSAAAAMFHVEQMGGHPNTDLMFHVEQSLCVTAGGQSPVGMWESGAARTILPRASAKSDSRTGQGIKVVETREYIVGKNAP